MTEQDHPLNTLQDIKKMMERSSRFISLSGLSGVSAGVCALVGAWFAYGNIHSRNGGEIKNDIDMTDVYVAVPKPHGTFGMMDFLGDPLLHIAVITFIAAFISAFIFTYLRSRKNNVPIWGVAARRLMVNVSIPLVAGGLYVLKIMQIGNYGLIAPGSLIFYGLALVNAGKYTVSEVRYLGYCQLFIGLINLVYVHYGLYFWALGFGVMHIIYGTAMWWKYERSAQVA